MHYFNNVHFDKDQTAVSGQCVVVVCLDNMVTVKGGDKV